MRKFSLMRVVAIVGVVALAGCGDKPEPKAPVAVGSSAPAATQQAPAAAQQPPAATQQAPADPLAPRYEATLAEGIDFKKPGYPSFLAEVSGMSTMYEPWGRWSEGGRVAFKFKQPLPTNFTLVVHGGAFGPNTGQPIKVKAGTVVKEIIFSSDPFQAPSSHRLNFQLDAPVSLIEITVPQPSQPSNGDTRKLGIGIIALKVEG